jgi:hypothetical protein
MQSNRPFDLVMYKGYTSANPKSGEPFGVVRHRRDRKAQHVLIRF